MILIYGATGYTGTLIAEACAARKIDAVVAGRNEAAVRALGERLGLRHRAVALDDTDGLARAVADSALVLHCAGPFARTSRPMVDACLKSRRHYLDITGEIDVFEACQARAEEAKRAGVVLLPGVGFDVVPSDNMAAHAKRRLPTATSLDLVISTKGAVSHGTASTVVEHLHTGGMVRRGGRLVEEPAAARTRTVDVLGKPMTAVSTPWGDVSTAWHSTGIPDITVYFTFAPRVRALMRASRSLAPLLRVEAVRRFAQRFVPAGGPDAAARARGRTVIIAEARDGARAVRSTLVGPEGYAFTVETAVLCAQRMLAAPPAAGAHTPSTAFGPDLVLEVNGVSRTDDA